jgi:molybdopterin/thiamine biosynthesis adenylyltransferase
MDLNKSREFFNPTELKTTIHIIGCGAIGSSVAELLTRQGCTDIHLWDMDVVESHNLVNQMYLHTQVNMKKTDALWNLLYAINPELNETVQLHDKYTGQNLSGYVFLCVDNIETRKDIVKANQSNQNIKAMFDFRMTLTEGQHFAADWNNLTQVENFLATMDFTHEEAKQVNEISACGFELSVAPTVRMITALGIANFMNFVNTKKLKVSVISSPFRADLLAF